MKKSLYLFLLITLCAKPVSAGTLETAKSAAGAGLTAASLNIGALKTTFRNGVGEQLSREELEQMTERELMLREIQLVREADASSLGEAYAYEEALVNMELHARTKMPGSDEAADLSGVLKALAPIARNVRSSGLTPGKMAQPDFLFTGPSHQASFFALIDTVFGIRFGSLRSQWGLKITDEQLARFGLNAGVKGVGAVIEGVGSRTRDPWLLVYYGDKRLDRVRHTRRYNAIEAERKIIRELL